VEQYEWAMQVHAGFGMDKLTLGQVRLYNAADKSLALPTSTCILFDGENNSFDASLVIYINSTNIPPIMIINRIYEYVEINAN
jgi:hypothetical protein